MNNLVGIFMRFRKDRTTISGDIEAMFNQVAVPPEDQVALRFLWSQSPGSEAEVYQYQRHIFGAKCAPTCSNYALLRSAEENKLQFPTAALAVKRNFYMDDFFKSVESSSEALELQQQLVAMLKLAGFNLTKWISNEKEVIERIPVSGRAPSERWLKKKLSCMWNVLLVSFRTLTLTVLPTRWLKGTWQNSESDSIIVRSNWVPGSIPGGSKNPSSTIGAVWYWLG